MSVTDTTAEAVETTAKDSVDEDIKTLLAAAICAELGPVLERIFKRASPALLTRIDCREDAVNREAVITPVDRLAKTKTSIMAYLVRESAQGRAVAGKDALAAATGLDAKLVRPAVDQLEADGQIVNRPVRVGRGLAKPRLFATANAPEAPAPDPHQERCQHGEGSGVGPEFGHSTRASRPIKLGLSDAKEAILATLKEEPGAPGRGWMREHLRSLGHRCGAVDAAWSELLNRGRIENRGSVTRPAFYAVDSGGREA